MVSSTSLDQAGRGDPGEMRGDASQPVVAVRLRDVTKLQDISRSQRRRHARNEALNTLIEFGEFFLRARTYASGPARRGVSYILRDLSLDVQAGSVVGVVDLGGRSRKALLDIAGGMALPHRGLVERRGRTVNLRQILALAAPDLSCRENLLLLGTLFGISRQDMKNAFPAIVEFSGLEGALDRPLRRTDRGEFMDLAISAICCLDFDIIVADEVTRPSAERVLDAWYDRLATANARDQTFLISSKKLDNIFDVSTHLLLLENGGLRGFGPTLDILHSEEEFIEQAIAAPYQDDSEALQFDDDEEGGGMEEMDLDFTGAADDAAWSKEAGPPPRRGGIQAALSEAEQARARTQGAEQPVSEIAYVTRGSDLVRVEYPGVAFLLHPDLSEIRPASGDSPIAEITQNLPLVYREDGAVFRLGFETCAPNLTLRPGLDLMRSKKTPALRMISPEAIPVERPSKVSALVTVPSELLELIPYTASTFVAVHEQGASDPDIAILKNFGTFAVGTRSSSELEKHRAQGKSTPLPMLRTSCRLASERCDSHGLLHLYGRWFTPVRRAKGDQQPLVDGSLALGRTCAETAMEVTAIIDIKQKGWTVLRCESERPLALESGVHELIAKLPTGLLNPDWYDIEVTLNGSTRDGGEPIDWTAGRLPRLWIDSGESAGDLTAVALRGLPPALARCEADWRISVEALEECARRQPEETGDVDDGS